MVGGKGEVVTGRAQLTSRRQSSGRCVAQLQSVVQRCSRLTAALRSVWTAAALPSPCFPRQPTPTPLEWIPEETLRQRRQNCLIRSQRTTQRTHRLRCFVAAPTCAPSIGTAVPQSTLLPSPCKTSCLIAQSKQQQFHRQVCLHGGLEQCCLHWQRCCQHDCLCNCCRCRRQIAAFSGASYLRRHLETLTPPVVSQPVLAAACPSRSAVAERLFSVLSTCWLLVFVRFLGRQSTPTADSAVLADYQPRCPRRHRLHRRLREAGVPSSFGRGVEHQRQRQHCRYHGFGCGGGVGVGGGLVVACFQRRVSYTLKTSPVRYNPRTA